MPEINHSFIAFALYFLQVLMNERSYSKANNKSHASKKKSSHIFIVKKNTLLRYSSNW